MFLNCCKQTPDPIAGGKPGEQRSFDIGHGVSLEFRWVPAGEFTIQNPLARPGEENPEVVPIRNAFWIAENEATVAVWKSVMGREPSMVDKSAKNPLAQVSWNECSLFLKRLKSPLPGWKFDLPSEVQWEYACRAGSNSADARRPAKLKWINVSTKANPNPIDMRAAMSWSIRDMHGNVAEWCRDVAGAQAATRHAGTQFLRFNRVGFRLILVREHGQDPAPLPPVCKAVTSRMP